MLNALKSLFKRNVADKRVPLEQEAGTAKQCQYEAKEAGFTVTYAEGRLSFYLNQLGLPLFSVSGLSFAEPERQESQMAGYPADVYNFGNDFTVTFINPADNINFTDQLTIKKAGYRQIPNQRQGLDIEATFGTVPVRYLVDLATQCAIGGFKEVVEDQLPFAAAPPIHQMVAFLKAVMLRRRTVMRSLKGLSRRVSQPNVLAVVNFIVDNFTGSENFLHYNIVKLRDKLERSQRKVNVNSLVAMCLLADIYLGNITIETLRSNLEQKTVVNISLKACLAVEACLLGQKEVCNGPEVRGAFEFINGIINERTFSSILRDFAEDGGNPGSIETVSRLLTILGERGPGEANEPSVDATAPSAISKTSGVAVDSFPHSNRVAPVSKSSVELRSSSYLPKVLPAYSQPHIERSALCSLLEANGKKVNPPTVAALCLYVDIEANIIRASQIEQFRPEIYLNEHSLYAVLAVGRAFGLDLRCLNIKGDTTEGIVQDLGKLLRLTNYGALVRFTEPKTFRVKDIYIDKAVTLQKFVGQGYNFTGRAIVSLPTLEQVDSKQLAVFLRKRLPLMACFQADDCARRWQLLDSNSRNEGIPVAVVGRYGFVEGFRAYRFHNRLVGRIVTATPDTLIGRQNVVVVYVDDRNRRSYRFFEKVEEAGQITSLSGTDLKFAGEVVELPEVSELHSIINEEAGESLFGLDDSPEPELERLIACLNGVRVALLNETEMVSLAEARDLIAVVRTVLRSSSFRYSLIEVMGYFSICKAVALLGNPGQALRGNILVTNIVAKVLRSTSVRLQELAVMLILYAMNEEGQGTFASQHFFWSSALFRSLIQEKIVGLLRTGDAQERVFACLLLASRIFASARDAYETSVYMLSSLLYDPQVGLVASLALARLVLSTTLGIPSDIVFTNWKSFDVTIEAEAEAADEIRRNIVEWLNDPHKTSLDKALEVPALANIRGEEDKISLLGLYMSKLNTKLRQERGRSDSRHYLVLSTGLDYIYRQRILNAWHGFFTSRKMPIADKNYGKRIYADYAEYAAACERESNISINVLKPDLFEVKGWYQVMPGADSFFLRLASMIPPPKSRNGLFENDLPIICRCPETVREGEPLDLGCCEVLCFENNEWLPFFHKRFARTLHLDDYTRALYDSLGDIYDNITSRQTVAVNNEMREAEPDSMVCASDVPAVAVADRCPACTHLEELAERIGEEYRLSGTAWRQVLNILLGIRAKSLYKLPPYFE